MQKKMLVFMLCIVCSTIQAQELFVFTEPASNVPANAMEIRLANKFVREIPTKKYIYEAMPELMYGINNKWMLGLQSFVGDNDSKTIVQGASLYTKYRFLSNDEVHSHFRMAGFARLSFNNTSIHQEQIETMGSNTGYELGVVATKLMHKFAFSSSISFEQAFDNSGGNKLPVNYSTNAMNYTLSLGKLMLPMVYKSYNQTNINLMVELLGQRLNDNGKSYLDIAPSVQFIVKSRVRIDIAYRKELYSTMIRNSEDGFMLKLVYQLYNVFEKHS